MSLFTQAQLCQVTELFSTISTLYTVPSQKNTIIKSILVCNKVSTDKTFTIHFVSASATASSSNKVFGEVIVSGNSTQLIDLSSVLPTGTTVQAMASASASINIHISGVEVE